MSILDAKIKRLRQYYLGNVNHPVIRNLAYKITAGAKTNKEKVIRIANWVRNNIRYQREPPKLDIIVPPLRLINLRAGDCEDLALFISTLAGAVGIPSKWKVISQDGQKWNHIYPLLLVNGSYKPMDLTVSLPLFGEVRSVKARIYDI